RLLETVRQYARERLQAAGEEEALRSAHLSHFLKLAEAGTADSTPSRPNERSRLDHLEKEIGNVRSALDWSQEIGEAALGLRLASEAGGLWIVRGFLAEGRQRIHALLSLPGAATRTAERAMGLLMAANLDYLQSDFEQALTAIEESLAIGHEL